MKWGPDDMALPAALAATEAPAQPASLPLPGPTALGPVYGVAFGQMAEELLLASQHVEPTKLLSSGYAVQNVELAGALTRVMASSTAPLTSRRFGQ